MNTDELIVDPRILRIVLTLALYILLPLVIIAIFKRKRWMQRCGTVIAAYGVGLFMALTGLSHFPVDSMEELVFSQWQNTIMNVTVPLAIPLLLFNCDFRLWIRALPKTVIALLVGVFSVLASVLIAYLVMRSSDVPELGKLCAMLTGMYTGGTMNFNALGVSFNVDKSLMAMVLAFDMLLTVPFYLFFIGGGYKVFRKWLPFNDETTPAFRRKISQVAPPVSEVEDYRDMTSRDNFPGMMLGLLLSVAFLLIGLGVSYLFWLIGWIPSDPDAPELPVFNELVIILTITTLSIIASFSERIHNLPKTFELGMFFILIFSVVLASLFDWRAVHANTIHIGLLVLFILLGTALIHALLCRITRVSGDLYTISLVALLCSPPFIPPIVGAMGNKKVLMSGIVIGLVGYAVGTYLGVAVALLLHAI